MAKVGGTSPSHEGSAFDFFAVRTLGRLGGLVVFELLEFGILAMIVCLSRSVSTRRLRAVAGAAIASLTLLPFFRYGRSNDLVMRASIPALFALCVLIGRTLAAPTVKRLWKTALLGLLLVGMFTGAVELRRHLSWHNVANWSRLADPGPTLPEVNEQFNRENGEQDWFIHQYVGRADALFFRWFAKDGPNR